jgi:Tfp pilus assembly protein PilF
MPTSRQNIVVLCFLLAALTLASYNPIVRNQFIDYDDLSYIQQNPHVVGGLTWKNVAWSFTTARDGNWDPLTWISHAFDCQVFGLNPLGHHYVSLLIHVASAVLLFLLLQQATGSLWPSLFVAALFALHPVNVESVAWAAERKNVLSMFFFLLTLYVYDRYARTRKRYLYLSVIVFFACGLMSKAQVVTLPFVLLLWDYWPLQRMNALEGGAPTPGRQLAYLVWEKLPLFFLAAVGSAIAFWAQGNGVRGLAEVPLSMRIGNTLVSYVRYVGKAFWPSGLAPMYPRSPVLAGWEVAGCGLLLLVVSAIVLRWRDQRYLAVGWFWFLGTLVPMIGIVAFAEQSMADRFAYIPFIGLFVAVVWTLNSLASSRRIPGRWSGGIAFVVVIIWGGITYRQVSYWHDSETLWRHTLSVTDGNYVAHNNLGVALAKQGRFEEALLEYRAGNSLHRYSSLPLLGLGHYELLLGHTQQAIANYSTVLHESTDPRIQAAAWSELGHAAMQLQHYEEAAANYRNALRLSPDDSGALVGTALLAMRQGQSDVAIAQFFHAMKVEPSDANVLLFAQALRRGGRSAEADSVAAQVQKTSTDLRAAQFETGRLLSLAGLKLL